MTSACAQHNMYNGLQLACNKAQKISRSDSHIVMQGVVDIFKKGGRSKIMLGVKTKLLNTYQI